MKSLIDRIRFKLAFHQSFPFVYDKETGEGLTAESYSVFTDMINYRTSRFGYVTGGGSHPRPFFIHHYSQPGWAPLK